MNLPVYAVLCRYVPIEAVGEGFMLYVLRLRGTGGDEWS